MDLEIKKDILEALSKLSTNDQYAVLSFARSLKENTRRKLTGKELVEKFGGCLSPDVCDRMEKVIEEDCGRIDYEGW